MLYFSGDIAQEKKKGEGTGNPVFVLDIHRNGLVSDYDGLIDNNYSFIKTDFPTAHELKAQGISKIIYLNEGDQEGRINTSYQSTDRLAEDLKSVISEWSDEGIKILYTGIAPLTYGK